MPTQKTLEADSMNESVKNQSSSKRQELNVVRQTEHTDRLLITNKNLQKELHDAETEIERLEEKLNDETIKISKNLFYAFLVVIIVVGHFINEHLVNVNTKLIEISITLQNYKIEIDKMKDSQINNINK